MAKPDTNRYVTTTEAAKNLGISVVELCEFATLGIVHLRTPEAWDRESMVVIRMHLEARRESERVRAREQAAWAARSAEAQRETERLARLRLASMSQMGQIMIDT
jgi:hypothetical protein